MFIYIKGVHFENKGAELMLQLIAKMILKKGGKIVLSPSLASPYEKRIKLGAYQLFSIRKGRIDLNKISYFIPKKFRNWMKDWFGILLESDIDAVLDASGFAYGDQWNLLGSEQLVKQVDRLVAHGKKYIFLPQAFGPFTREIEAKRMKSAFEKSSLVFARDDNSLEYAKELYSGVLQSPDFTCLIETEKQQCTDKCFCIIPNSNVLSGRAGEDRFKENEYINLVCNLASNLYELGYSVNVFNHEDYSDKAICENICKKLNEGGVVSNYKYGLNALDTKKFIGTQTVVFSSRFHGCVSALTQGVPCLATSWSHKYKELYKYYNAEKFLLTTSNTSEELIALLKEIDDNIESIGRDLLKVKKRNKKESEEMFQKVFDELFFHTNKKD